MKNQYKMLRAGLNRFYLFTSLCIFFIKSKKSNRNNQAQLIREYQSVSAFGLICFYIYFLGFWIWVLICAFTKLPLVDLGFDFLVITVR